MGDTARAVGPARDGSASRRFLTFRVRERGYALPAEVVSEVILVPPVARLPHAPTSLMGLANLRGAVIPIVDPGVVLGLPGFVTGGGARAIVLSGMAPVAIAVDGVDALVTLDDARIETRQAELAAEPGEQLIGAFQTGAATAVTKVLDLPALLRAAFGERTRREPRPAVARGAATPETRAATVEQRLLISFEVAGQDYALALDAVHEIIPLPDTISVVPGAETALLGVTAWRDALLPLLSLRALLGFPAESATTGREKVIVTAVHGARVGLVADRSRALLRADVSAIDPAPAMLAARTGGESRVTAIFRGDGGRRLVALLAPDHLFREDTMRRLSEQAATPAAATAVTASGASLQFVVFRLGDEEFGLPIAAVDEVARVPEQLTRVPKMPDFLEGVINLRGEVLPVVDQRRRFALPKFAGSGRRLVVVRTERHRAGLIVDSVSEVLRVRSEAIEPAPDLTGEADRLVTGVLNLGSGERMILLLDPAELLTQTERGVLDRLGPPDSPGP